MRSSFKKLVLAALLVVFVLIGIRVIEGLSASSAVTPLASTAANSIKPTPTGGGKGRIAFMTYHDDKNQIYTSNADGTELIHLADVDFDPWQLQWALDGKHLALHSMEGDIYVMKADGSNLIRLAKTEVAGLFSWSPDSKKIVFDSYEDMGASFLSSLQLYTINIDGTGLNQLTHGPDSHGLPAWSPDGRQIAFQFTKDPFAGDYEIHLINTDSSKEVSLASGFDQSQDILWSPDGKQLLIASGIPIQLYVMNADGSQRKQLTNTLQHNLQPSWSPDGKQILYAALNKDRGSRIYVINTDGSEQKRLTNDPDTADGYAEWSPDGQWITYMATLVNPEVNCCTSCCVNTYMMKANGSGQRKLTNEIGSTWYATWQP